MSGDARTGAGVSHPLFKLFLVSLAISVALLSLVTTPARAALFGFDLSSAVFASAVLRVMVPASPETLRNLAAQNDAGRRLLLVITAVLLLVVLVVVGFELAGRGRASVFDVALVVVSLVLAWLFGSLVFAMHYAHRFFDCVSDGTDHGGLSFPGTDNPTFLDFCYFAFVLGMTFQVSDVQITSSRIRAEAMVHGLIAFMFNIGILALTVNLVANSIASF